MCIRDRLKAYGVEKYISFDLGMLSKYHYYTGVIFKAFSYGVGDAIVKGGRYDKLLGCFEMCIRDRHTNQLINEHEIMQQAYAQANEVVTMATKQAQEILENATMEANSVRSAAMQYTYEILANVEALINQTMKTTTEHYESFMAGLNHYNDVVNSNRVELNPPEPDKFEAPEGDLQESTTGSINVDML